MKKEIEDTNEKYQEAKQVKDNLQEHLDFIVNELKLVKEVNLSSRQENNRVMQQYLEMAKTLEDLKMNQFNLNETNIQMKKEVGKMIKQVNMAKEEKEIAEAEYVRILITNCKYSCLRQLR